MVGIPIVYGSSGVCINCRMQIQISDSHFIAFFSGCEMYCRGCNCIFNLGKVVTNSIIKDINYYKSRVANLLGACEKHVSISVEPEKYSIIYPNDIGIDKHCTILNISINAEGDNAAHPILSLGQHPSEISLNDEIMIYGMSYGKPSLRNSKTTVIISFIPNPNNLNWLRNISQGIRAYADGTFRDAAPILVTGLEELSFLTINKLLGDSGINKVTKLGWSTIFNVILPLLADRNDVPRLSEELTKAAKDLYSVRNTCVHEGKYPKNFDESLAPKLACDSILVSRYLDLLGKGWLVKPEHRNDYVNKLGSFLGVHNPHNSPFQ